MSREVTLQRLYYWFWKSEDFCEDFESVWHTEYHALWNGRSGSIADFVLDCAAKWAKEWLINNGYI